MYRFWSNCLLALFLVLPGGHVLAQYDALSTYVRSHADDTANIQALKAALLKHPGHDVKTRLEWQDLLVQQYIKVQDYENAILQCQSLLNLARKQGAVKEETSALRWMGNIHYLLRELPKARQMWGEALLLAEKYQYHEYLKVIYHNYAALAYEGNPNLDSAEQYLLKSIHHGLLAKDSSIHLGKNYRLLATTYEQQGKLALAEQYFLKSMSEFTRANDEAGVAEARIFRARLYKTMQQLGKAHSTIRPAIEYARTSGNDLLYQTSLALLSEIYRAEHNYKAAVEATDTVIQLQNKINLKNREDHIAEAETRFKVSSLKYQQEKEKLILGQKQRTAWTIAAFVVLTIVAFLVFYFQRKIARKESDFKIKHLKDLYTAEENERSRIARDLHDNLGAYATSMLAQIDRLQISPSSVPKLIPQLRTDAALFMDMLRETIWVLKYKSQTVESFFDRIKLYTDRHLVRNLQVQVKYTESGDSKNVILSPSEVLALYRMVQESIQNIVKHAKANIVEIALIYGEKPGIAISDNGVGFDLDAINNESGLQNMQSRASEIGYQVHLSSIVGKGTSLKFLPKL